MHHLGVLRHRPDQEPGAGTLEELPDRDGSGEPEHDQEEPIERERLIENHDDAAQHIRNAGAKRLRTPDNPDQLAQHDCEPEGEQQIGAAVAPTVERAQEDALERHADGADDDRCDDQRDEEASADRGGGVADIGAEHEDDAVRKIDDAHDAEDQGQPAGDEEQDRRLRKRTQALRQDETDHLLKLELRQSGVFSSRG